MAAESNPPDTIAAYVGNLSLYVLDKVRTCQDNPKYAGCLVESDLVEMLRKEPFACGDLEAQIITVLMDLTNKRFVRFMNGGFRTLGPMASLCNAKKKSEFIKEWDRLSKSYQ